MVGGAACAGLGRPLRRCADRWLGIHGPLQRLLRSCEVHWKGALTGVPPSIRAAAAMACGEAACGVTAMVCMLRLPGKIDAEIRLWAAAGLGCKLL